MFTYEPRFFSSFKFLLLVLCLLFFGFREGFGIAYITEVQSQGAEFIEVYSDTFLNLSGILVQDISSKSKSLQEIYSNPNSSLYLIICLDFNESLNFSSLNASVFYSGYKDKITSSGLSTSGENISIYINSSELNLSFSLGSLTDNSKSYNYDILTGEYFISEQTPGVLSFKPNISINGSISNQTNLSNNTNTSNLSNSTNCNYSFKVLTKSDIFEDKLEFWFDTNATDYEIEYFVEDYSKIVKKIKVKTKNLDKKSFSSDLGVPEVYYVRGKLIVEACEISNFTKVIYYPKTKEVVGRSYIKILNSNDILLGIDDFVEYEVYRGETDKRTIYFKINGKEFNKFDVEKFSKIVGKISLHKITKNSTLEISGLDKIETLEIEVSNLESINNTNNNSRVLEPSNSSELGLRINYFKAYLDYVNFSLSGFNFSGFCYVYQDRTLLSSKLFVNDSGDYDLSLNLSKIDVKKNESEFKLTCKYKKGEYLSDFYDNFIFDYNISLILDENSSCDNCFDLEESNLSRSYFEVNETYLAFSGGGSEDVVLNASLEKGSQNISENVSGFVSKSSNLKQNSFFFVFLACVILVIILIFKR